MQKSVVFLHTSNYQNEKLRKSYLQLRQRVKYLDINVTEMVKDLHTESCENDERN